MNKLFSILAVLLITTNSINASPTPANGKASNFSFRAELVSKPIIQGISVTDGTKVVLLRAIGNGLTQFNIAGVLVDPEFTLFGYNSVVIGKGKKVSQLTDSEYDRLVNAQIEAGAFPLNRTSNDCIMLIPISGIATMHVKSISGKTGEVLVEAYILPSEEFDRSTRIIDN